MARPYRLKSSQDHCADGPANSPSRLSEGGIERIVTLADSYDAMVSDRPYRATLSPVEARQEIQAGAGTQFDPVLVRTFQGLLGRGEELLFVVRPVPVWLRTVLY